MTELHVSLRAGTIAAVFLLAWGALPYLPGQIDDSYIVFAYAHRILEHREITWNTGVRVEGYSSPAHLAAMVLALAAGADLALFAKALSFGCSATLLLHLARRASRASDLLPALLLAAWQPFQHWSVAGLETALAALIGALAWTRAVGKREAWAGGTLLLVFNSLVRPEGLAWLALALARRLTMGRAIGRPEAVVAGGLAGLAAYHLARWSYFGHLVPTPYVVKIAAIHEYGLGATQLIRELASASGILVATVLLRRTASPWIWAPLAIQSALLVRAGGDWMGHARFVVPGLAASVAAAWAHGEPRSVSSLASPVVAALAVAGFAWAPSHEGEVNGQGALVGGWRDFWFLRHPVEALRTPWAVPLLEETAFLIERVPAGAGAAISDVGLPGNLDDIRIWDNAGLTDRVTAEIIASPSGEIVQAILDRYGDPDDVWCLRYGRGKQGDETADPWLVELLPEVSPSRSKAAHLTWRCRAGGMPSQDVVSSRWGRLLARYPSQDWIRWYYARALLVQGRIEEAAQVAEGARWAGSGALGWIAFGEAPSASYQPSRGWALYANGSRRSIPAPPTFWANTRPRVDVDDPGADGAVIRLRWEPECGEPLESTLFEATTLEAPACLPGATSRSLLVEFTNDQAADGFDRNVYVSLASH